MEKISVIIPVYNVEAFLERCVQSVLQQTYSELEILLVDDGSTDASGALCDALVQKDPRIRCIHQKNGGLSAARNTGIEACTGAWLLFLDSDDWYDPTLVETLYRACQQLQVPLAECSYRCVYREAVTLETACTGQTILGTAADAIEGCLNWELYRSIACNKLLRRDIVGDIRFPVGRLHEDEFTTHLFYAAAGQVAFVDVALYNYDRTREESITARFTLRNLRDACEAFRQKMHFIWEHPEFSRLDAKVADCYCYVLFERLTRAFRAGLDGPELDDTIRAAVAEAPALAAHGAQAQYLSRFDALAHCTLTYCMQQWSPL